MQSSRDRTVSRTQSNIYDGSLKIVNGHALVQRLPEENLSSSLTMFKSENEDIKSESADITLKVFLVILEYH